MSQEFPFDTQRIAIYADPTKKEVVSYRRELMKGLRDVGIACFKLINFSSEDFDLIIVLGGDGYMLELIKQLHFTSIPILGINYGTVGALMNPRVPAPILIKAIQNKLFKIRPCKSIVCEYEDFSEKRKKVIALNEFVLERSSTTTIRLDIYLDGHRISRYSGDGLIVSTPIGSTAYSLAAGGPVLHSQLEAFALTPICPHKPIHFKSLTFPIVLPMNSLIQVDVLQSDTRQVRLIADGKSVKKVKSVLIKAMDKQVNLVRFLDYSFTGELVRNIIGDIKES